MATIYLQLFTKKDNKLMWNVPVVGKTMTKSWIAKNYGKDSEITGMWRCHKNPYGIEWIIASESRYGGISWDYCTDPKKAVKKFPGDSFSYRIQGYIA